MTVWPAKINIVFFTIIPQCGRDSIVSNDNTHFSGFLTTHTLYGNHYEVIYFLLTLFIIITYKTFYL